MYPDGRQPGSSELVVRELMRLGLQECKCIPSTGYILIWRDPSPECPRCRFCRCSHVLILLIELNLSAREKGNEAQSKHKTFDKRRPGAFPSSVASFKGFVRKHLLVLAQHGRESRKEIRDMISVALDKCRLRWQKPCLLELSTLQ